MNRVVAVIVYIGPKVRSAALPICLKQIGGRSILNHLTRRLERGFANETAAKVFVACHRDVFVELSDAGNLSHVDLFISDGVDRTQVIGDLAANRCQVGTTLIVYPENAVFPDCITANRMLRFHRSVKADATVAPSLPTGFLPEIIEGEALRRLRALPFPSDMSLDAVSIMRETDARLRPSTKFTFSVRNYEPQSGDPEPTLLPATCEARTTSVLQAAEQLFGDETIEIPPNWSGAYALREALLRSAPAPEVFRRSSGTDVGMPVLYCSSATAFSGAEESFYLLVSRIQPPWQPVVLLNGESHLFRKLTAAGIPVTVADEDLTSLSPRVADQADSLLKGRRISLCHIDGTSLPMIAAVARLNAVPVVQHVRTLFGRNAPETFRFATRLIAISDLVADDLACSNFDRSKIVRIYNPIQPHLSPPPPSVRQEVRASLKIGETDFLFVMVARISRQKRQAMLLQALDKLKTAQPRTYILFVGETYATERHYFAGLIEFIREKNLKDHVRFVDFEADIAVAYAAADALVLCTEREPLGRCVMEAMACGVPVIVPTTGGHSELMEHGISGLKFNPHDLQSLVDAMNLLLSRSDLRMALTRQALDKARDYSVDGHVEAVARVYSDLLIT